MTNFVSSAVLVAVATALGGLGGFLVSLAVVLYTHVMTI